MTDNRLTPRNFSVRLTKEAERQLAELMKFWGENRSQALSRCIQITFMREYEDILKQNNPTTPA